MEDKKMDIWIITDWDLGNRPIIVASSRDKAIKQLFDYIGYDGKDNDRVIYHGFKEHDYNEEENERSLIGTFTFDYFFTKWEKDEYHLYELILDKEQKIIPYEYKKTINNMKKSGIELIAIERQEQLEKHGRTVEKDVLENKDFELSYGASKICNYALDNFKDEIYNNPPSGWDLKIWQKILDKPYKERLIIAGALIAAEIDRLQAINEK